MKRLKNEDIFTRRARLARERKDERRTKERAQLLPHAT